MTDVVSFDAQAEGVDLLRGCGDIPEVVALTERFRVRALRVDRYLQELNQKEQEIRSAEKDLHSVLSKISQHRAGSGLKKKIDPDPESVKEDIARLVSVYDQMKPEMAANIMENLPPEFSAEILMRIQPENSAKIIASISANHAATLTTYMGSRHVRK